MSTPFRLLVPRRIYDALLEQARAEFPNECCGLLAGRIEGDAALALRHYPLVNALASPVEYESEPRSMFRAVKDMRQHGTDVVGVYHSHPTSEPVPSRKDLQRSYSPDVVNLIISLRTGGPAVRAWWLDADGYREAAWEITEGAA